MPEPRARTTLPRLGAARRARAAWPTVLLLALLASGAAAGPADSPDELRRLLDAGEHGRALEVADALLAGLVASDDSSERDVERARLSLRRVEALLGLGRAREPATRRAAEAALATLERSGTERDRVDGLHVLGNVHRRAGDDERARPMLERALGSAASILSDDEQKKLMIVQDLANLHVRVGRYDEAERLYVEGIERCTRTPLPKCYLLLYGRGRMLGVQGKLADEANLYAKARALAAESLPPDHSFMDVVRQSMAINATDRGRYDEARDELLEVLASEEARRGPEHPRVAEVLYSLGRNERYLGDYPAAERAFERSHAIRSETLGNDDPLTAYALAELGVVLRATGREDAGCAAVRDAFDVLETRLDRRHPNWRATQAIAASCDVADARFSAAEERLEAWTGSRGADALGHPEARAQYLRVQSKLQRARGESEPAIASLERALREHESLYGSSHPHLAADLSDLAEASWEAGRPADAVRWAERLESLRDRLDPAVIAGLSEREALEYIESRRAGDAVVVSALLAAPADSRQELLDAAWRRVLRRRHRVFDELAVRRQVLARERSEAAGAAWERLAAARRALATLWVSTATQPRSGHDLERLERAVDEREAAERALAGLSKTYRSLAESRSVRVDDVARALPSDAALVEILRVEVRVPGAADGAVHDVALTLGGDGTRSVVDLGPSAAIDARIEAWLSALATSFADESSAEAGRDAARAGDALRRLVWDPLLPAMGSPSRVFLVPEAGHHLVVHAALPSGASSGAYLGETGPAIHLLATGRDLVAASAARPLPSARGLVALGDPRFPGGGALDGEALRGVLDRYARGSDAACLPRIPGTWPALPATAREIRRVASLVDGGPHVTLRGDDASEPAFRKAVAGRRIVHVATHAFFLDAACGGDAEPATGAGGDRYVPPLLRSGLVLAGAGGDGVDAEADGILTAEEIAALDLAGAELVVLSACETGVGTIGAGEGVFGLRRAFELAGARQVVASLWPVPDRDALRWMTEFYRALAGGASPIDAAASARQASLERLRRRGGSTHPYRWAGFVTAGRP